MMAFYLSLQSVDYRISENKLPSFLRRERKKYVKMLFMAYHRRCYSAAVAIANRWMGCQDSFSQEEFH